MAKNIDNFSESVIQTITSRPDAEEPLSAEEREQIIQDLISTQMIEGIDLTYDEAAEIVDEVFSGPMPVMK